MILTAATVAAGVATAQEAQQIQLPPEILAQLQQQQAKPIAIEELEKLMPEVVGKVNGKDVTRQEALTLIKDNANALRYFGRVPAENLPAELKKFIQDVLVEKMLVNAIDAAKMVPTEEEAAKLIKEKIDAELSNPDVRKQAEDQLKQAGKTLDGYIQEMAKDEKVRQSIGFERFFDKLFADNKVGTEESAKKFYDENKEMFTIPDTALDAAHILIAVDANASEEDWAAAKTKAEDLLKRVQNGEDFAQIAKENSACPSKEQGGELGTFEAQQMVPEFSEAVIMAEPGAVVATPVKTKFGYHIIRRNATEKMVAFDKVAKDIENMEKQKFVENFVKEMSAKDIVNLMVVPEAAPAAPAAPAAK